MRHRKHALMKSIAVALKQSDDIVLQDSNNADIHSDSGCGIKTTDVFRHSPCNNSTVDNNDTCDTVGNAPDIDLHLNLWKLKSRFFSIKPRLFLDIGIKADCQYNQICIYLPFALKKKKPYEDLGDVICNSNNLLCAIFNDDLRAVAQTNKCFYRIENNSPEKGDKDHFYFYVLGDNNVSIEADPGTDGSWVNVKIEKCKDIIETEKTKSSDAINEKHCEYYIRFRLFIDDYKQIVKQRKLSNDLIQAAFSNIDLYDIRINEIRNLDKKVRERLEVNAYLLANFHKGHIFYIADTRVSVDTASTIKSDSRIIEQSIWKAYEPIEIKDGIFLAHHWKFTTYPALNLNIEQNKTDNTKADSKYNLLNMPFMLNPLRNLNLFFTAKYPKIHFITLLAYFSVIVLLGFIGSWLSSYPENSLWEMLTNLSTKSFIIWSMIVLITCHLVRNIRCSFNIWLKQS